MNIYDCFGTFDPDNQNFNLAVQTTNIGFDEFYVSQYYNICSPTRYAIVAILQTEKRNSMDISPCLPNCGMLDSNVNFSDLRNDFLNPNDLDITQITKNDELTIYSLHAIGFDLHNRNDNQNILDLKTEAHPILSKGSPPSKGGKGVLI